MTKKSDTTTTPSSQPKLPKFSFSTPAAEDTSEANASENKSESEPVAGGFSAFFANKWQCKVCMSHNDVKNSKCLACETPREDTPSSKDGASSESHDDKKDDTPPKFTFGGSSSGFSFSLPGSTSNSFSFGGSTSSTFTFGTAASLSSNSGFSFVNNSSSAASSSTSVQPGSGNLPASSELFKDSKPVSAGDENDTTHLNVVAQLYELKAEESKDDNEKPKSKFVLSGKGELHLNTYSNENGKILGRMIMRREKTHKLLLNEPIFPKLKHTLENDTYIRIITLTSDKKIKTILLRFANPEDSNSASKVLEKIISQV